MPNPVGHFEICCSDKNKGIEFYKSLFDWDFNEMDESYSLVSTGSEPGGGIMGAQGDMKPYLALYITVDDINATIDKAVSMGAHEIVRKTLISPEHGYYGMFVDPDGNCIGLWSKE